jgi:catalase
LISLCHASRLDGVAGIVRPDRINEPQNFSTRTSPLQSRACRKKESVPEEIKKKQLKHFAKADPAYGAEVAKALDMPHETPNPIP